MKVASTENQYGNQYMQLQVEEKELEQQQACLQAWNNLQTDLQQLQHLFIDFSKIVHVST